MLRFALLSQVWPTDPDVRISGSNVQVFYIAQELAARGFPVLVLLSNHPSLEPIRRENLTVEPIPAGKGLRGQLRSEWIGAVKQRLADFRPDIVYQRGKLPDTIAAVEYVREQGGTFVWVSNSDSSGERWKYLKKRVKKRPDILMPFRVAEGFYADIRIEQALPHADLVLSQTVKQQQDLRRNFGMEAVVVGSGHPVPPYRETQNEIPRVLWLANLTTMKQPQIFAELASRLRHLPAEFVLAGRAPDREILNETLRIADGVERFRYAGPTSLEQGNALFRDADLFVLTSQFSQEGIPNTFVQSWLHAVPTLSMGHDPDGVIAANNIGAVVDDIDALTATVERWINDAELRQSAGRRAYEFARDNFSVQVLVDTILDTLQRRLSVDTDGGRSEQRQAS